MVNNSCVLVLLNKMTLELLVEHPLYVKFLKFASHVDSREKLLRLVQYFVKFLTSVKFQAAISPQFRLLLKSMQYVFTISRKPLRMVKPLNHLKLFSMCYSNQLSDPLLRLFESVKQLGFFFFFSFDIVVYMKMLGLLNVNSKLKSSRFVRNINKLSALMWCVALIGGILKNLRQSQIIFRRFLNKKESMDELEVEKEKLPLISLHKTQRELFKNVLDLVIASNLYGELGIDDSIVGGCGVITSIMGIQDLWDAAK